MRRASLVHVRTLLAALVFVSILELANAAAVLAISQVATADSIDRAPQAAPLWADRWCVPSWVHTVQKPPCPGG